MADFIGCDKTDINIGDPIIFENNTDSPYTISTGIIFHKSGIYDVSLVGNKTIVSKVQSRITSKWITDGHHIKCKRCGVYMCNTDREGNPLPINYCPKCGSIMEQTE